MPDSVRSPIFIFFPSKSGRELVLGLAGSEKGREAVKLAKRRTFCFPFISYQRQQMHA